MVFQQIVRCVELGNHTSIHYQNAIRINDSVQTVRNGKNGSVREVLLQDLLHGRVRIGVEGRGRFVQQQDAGWIQHGTGQANQLLGAEREVGAHKFDFGIQAVLVAFDDRAQQALSQNIPECLVGVLVEGIQVITERTREHDRFLGNDGHAAAKLVQVDVRAINVVDVDASFGDFSQTVQSDNQRTLAGTRTSNDTDFFTFPDAEIDTLERGWLTGQVGHDNTFKSDFSFGRPLSRGFDFLFGFLLGFQVAELAGHVDGLHVVVEVTHQARHDTEEQENLE